MSSNARGVIGVMTLLLIAVAFGLLLSHLRERTVRRPAAASPLTQAR